MSADSFFSQSHVVDKSVSYTADDGGCLFAFDNWAQAESPLREAQGDAADFFRRAQRMGRVDVLVLPGEPQSAWLVEVKDFRNCRRLPNIVRRAVAKENQRPFWETLCGKIDGTLELLSSLHCPGRARLPFEAGPYVVGIHMEASLPESGHQVSRSLILNVFAALVAARKDKADERLVLLNERRINADSSIPWRCRLLDAR